MNPMQPTLAPAPPHSAQDIHADNDLRAQLAAVINTPHAHQAQQQQQQQQQQHAHLQPPQQLIAHGYSDVPSSSASPHNIDPAIAGAAHAHAHHALDMMGGSPGGDSGDDNGDGRKGGKRELSQSKRAAQNRAAQRAFRQRKEGYIKKLEEQVRELHTLEDNYKVVQTENYSLRDYVLQLQRRLLESQGEYPQPPPGVGPIPNHSPRRALGLGLDAPPPPQPAPTAPMAAGPSDQQQQQQQQQQLQTQMAPLQAQLQASAAQAVADLRESAAKQRHAHEEYLARGAYKADAGGGAEDELGRQLQAGAEGMGGMQGM